MFQVQFWSINRIPFTGYKPHKNCLERKPTTGKLSAYSNSDAMKFGIHKRVLTVTNYQCTAHWTYATAGGTHAPASGYI